MTKALSLIPFSYNSQALKCIHTTSWMIQLTFKLLVYRSTKNTISFLLALIYETEYIDML